MNKTDIKKALYKQKPVAEFDMIRKGVAHYNTYIDDLYALSFEIPVVDMGDADFLCNMDAKLLIRWLVW
tara:strand:- start:30343 stop:30549 length:207 start_codon:yes stop_codon:yes gene_type:complete